MVFPAILVAVTLALSSARANPVTMAPDAKRTPSHADIKARATTYETTSPLPLTDYKYPYSAIPASVNPYDIGRGPQSGYNICNSTTEGDKSQCQTMELNSLADFCLWGSPYKNGVIGDVEAAVVAYCTKPGHGTRVMPAGTITGAQFMRTSAYIQITGIINQTGIEIQTSDTGGELDPHGDDKLGNPVGGLVYSTGMPSGDNTTYMQVTSWNEFVGSGEFCIKLCDPTVTTPNYCENRYDLIGCEYNMPASYKNNEFTVCDGELQDVVGTYTSGGQTLTWSQPAVLNTDPPYKPRTPSSSNCQTFSSADLFGAQGTSTAAPTSTAPSSLTTITSGGITLTSKLPTATGTTASSSTTSNAAGHAVVNTGLFALLGALTFFN